MTLPRLAALQREWRRSPPLRHMLAAFAGFKAPAERPEARPEMPEFED